MERILERVKQLSPNVYIVRLDKRLHKSPFSGGPVNAGELSMRLDDNLAGIFASLAAFARSPFRAYARAELY